MLETLKNAWRVKEIRRKILFTFLIILIFRIGSVIPVPFVDVEAVKQLVQNMGTNGDFFSYLSVLTGGAMEYGALFAMSVTPYINASIIMQLLTVAITPLQRIAKEEDGQKRIAKYTRFATVILGLIQGGAYWYWLFASKCVDASTVFENIFAAVVIILCFTAGTALMMWLGERIDEKGIGNGISILLFAGIISRVPQGVASLYAMFATGEIPQGIAVIIILLVVIVFIVWMQAAERRIPIQYAKRVVGRKQYGGNNTFMPIKVNMSGVMPIIFASSILTIPTQILQFMSGSIQSNPDLADGFWFKTLSLFNYQSWFYAVIYFAMIIAFGYFYMSIQYDPLEMANNLRKNGGLIPGIRSGKATQTYLSKILRRITLIGCIFLGAIAVLPIVVGQISGINLSLGGTSMLIVVGVAIDTVQQLESQMMMRHYKGFLD